MRTAVQTSARPTNKLLTGAVVAAGFTEAWANIMEVTYPPLAGPEFSVMIGAAVAVGVAWFVKDRPNIAEGEE